LSIAIFGLPWIGLKRTKGSLRIAGVRAGFR
jgi:hypothetical protein